MASLLYGCEVQSFSKKQLGLLRRFINRCLRGLTGTRTKEMKGKTTMTDVRKSLQMQDIETIIASRTLAWLGRVVRKGAYDQNGKPLLEYLALRMITEPESSAIGKGRDRRTWQHQATEWLRAVEGQDPQGRDWEQLAANPGTWTAATNKALAALEESLSTDTHANRHRDDAATVSDDSDQLIPEVAPAPPGPSGGRKETSGLGAETLVQMCTLWSLDDTGINWCSSATSLPSQSSSRCCSPQSTRSPSRNYTGPTTT